MVLKHYSWNCHVEALTVVDNLLRNARPQGDIAPCGKASKTLVWNQELHSEYIVLVKITKPSSNIQKVKAICI